MKTSLYTPLKFKAHSITGWLNLELMQQAFARVKANKGAAGVDKISIREFKFKLNSRLKGIIKDIADRNYQPSPLRRSYVPKPNGKKRPLGIPTIRDRLAQEALKRLLEPLFEPLFHDDSFGFRPGRSCHQALDRIIEYKKLGYHYVVDADIVGCFDNISFKVIMQALSAVIADGNILTTASTLLKCRIYRKRYIQRCG